MKEDREEVTCQLQGCILGFPWLMELLHPLIRGSLLTTLHLSPQPQPSPLEVSQPGPLSAHAMPLPASANAGVPVIHHAVILETVHGSQDSSPFVPMSNWNEQPDSVSQVLVSELNLSCDLGVSEQNEYFNGFGVCEADRNAGEMIVSEMFKVTFMFLGPQNIRLLFLFQNQML